MPEVFAGMGALQRALDYHLQRHNVLTSNVANVDTPGFRPQELLRGGPTGLLNSSLPLAETTEGHIASAPGTTADAYVAEEEKATPVGGDGNGVSLELEMSKLAANALRYQGAARLVTRQLAMLRYAASDAQTG